MGDNRSKSTLEIKGFKLVRNGYKMETKSTTGGIAIVNATYYPFFKARAGSKNLPVIPVNAVQMAIKIPPGNQIVSLIYERPSLAAKIPKMIDKMID